MNQKLQTIRTHVFQNRAKYTALVTLVVAGAVYRVHVKEVNAFLEANNLLDTYYSIEA